MNRLDPRQIPWPQAMQQAAAAYHSGDLARAEQFCRFVLESQPDQFDALSLAGIIASRAQRPEDAAELLARAVRARRHDAAAHNNYGIALKNINRLEAALKCYEQALRLNPRFAEAHYNRGNVLKELMRLEEALLCYARALDLNPNHAEAYNSRGLALQALNRTEQALDSYTQALVLKPGFAEACNNRGGALKRLDRPLEALADYGVALRIDPRYAMAYFNRAVLLQQLGRLDEALADYDRAIHFKPDFAEAGNNRGMALQALGRFGDAALAYEQVLARNPGFAEAHYNRGNALKDLGRLTDAVASYERAAELKPRYAHAHYNRGNVLKELQRYEDALAAFTAALAGNPDFPQAMYSRGTVLQKLKGYDEALSSYQSALRMQPDYGAAAYACGTVLQEMKRFDEALACYAAALRLDPELDWLYGVWLHAKMLICDWHDLSETMAAVAAGIRQARKISSPFPIVTSLDSLPLQRQTAETYVAAIRPAGGTLPPIAKHPRDGKIRIGYYSADFHDHATAFLLAGLIEHHDRQRFEVVALSFGTDKHDAMRQRLERAFDRFIDVRALTDRQTAQLSRRLQIDIAVDLKGFTSDSRPGIFAQRAAPIQVSYLGYPGTTGAPYIDYLIADATLIPAESRGHYSEKIVYLPNSYQVNDRSRAIEDRVYSRAELGLPEGGFVYCCFNGNYKITPAWLDVWIRILGQVEGSVLWLLESNEWAARNLRLQAQARGLDPARLIFAPRMLPPEHLARHRAADLFLDSLPCNAHTTASDALWAGLPVLTQMGESFAARVAASLIRAIGLPELVTTTTQQYEAMAIGLAADPARLKDLRSRLERNRLTEPLYDTPLFTRNLEAAYMQMVERSQADLAPEHLYPPAVARR